MTRYPTGLVAALALLCGPATPPSSGAAPDAFALTLRPALETHCTQCHGREKTKGRVDLHALTSPAQFLQNPRLLETLVAVIESGEMPPEEEPPLSAERRASLLEALRRLLASATASLPLPDEKIRRLNRFQYNNAVRDLFLIPHDLFALPEKLMTRHDDYLAKNRGIMPARLAVSCESFKDGGVFRGVEPFPKDLRAAHGFDNQSNQLTLSPLLLDAYLKLSRSILEDPDFNEQTVGVWNSLFAAPPPGTDPRPEIERRLRPFLNKAFRGALHDGAIARYADFATGRIQQGASFTEAMKTAASAVLSSPLFLFRYHDRSAPNAQFETASRLSFFLWGSAPDEQLLELASAGRLLDPDTLNQTVNRMLADPKIERFLDAFPTQWMQLENILGAAPDRQKHRFYSVDPRLPAAAQMVLEPLLLFDAAFVENRPLRDLIAPEFNYRSEFLDNWYTSDFKVEFDSSGLERSNGTVERNLAQISQELLSIQKRRATLLDQVSQHVPAVVPGISPDDPANLQPYAAWNFDGNLFDSIGGMHLQAQGRVDLRDGMAVLEDGHLEARALPVELKAKSLEAWIRLPGNGNASGCVMAVNGPGNQYDSIAFGGRTPGRWFGGAEILPRVKAFGGPQEAASDALIHLVSVHEKDGSTTLYRNGVPYGAPLNKGALVHPRGKASILFGRSTPADNGPHIGGLGIRKARLYDKALTGAEVAAAYAGAEDTAKTNAFALFMNAGELETHRALNETLAQTLKSLREAGTFQDPVSALESAQKKYDGRVISQLHSRFFRRTPASDARYGGIITNAAVLTMTSGPKRTLPIARGAWVIEVIFNDPPPPPPNNVPPLSEDTHDRHLTIREQFAKHRENPDCASCHSRIDPLGFALENFDGTGRWRELYENGRSVDASGTLFRRHSFKNIVEFKALIVSAEKRFAKAFVAHLLRFALARELTPADSPSIERILEKTGADGFRLRDLLREVILCDSFLRTATAPTP